MAARSHLPESDCERLRPGWIHQPVNTGSSLGYAAAGLWVWRRGRLASKVPAPVLGAAAIVAGLGSVAYHGPGGAVAHVAHDAGAAALAVTLAATAATSRPVPRRPGPALAAAVCAAGGGAVHFLSRTDRPLCAPDSRWQGHALWHLLGAAAVVLVAEAIREPAPPEERNGPAGVDGSPGRPTSARSPGP